MSGAPPTEPIARADLHRESSITFMMLLAAAERAFDARQFDVASGKLRAAEAVVARVASGRAP